MSGGHLWGFGDVCENQGVKNVDEIHVFNNLLLTVVNKTDIVMVHRALGLMFMRILS